MIVEISHVGDKTFYDALQLSEAPLIASHSSCRALCNHARNMSDDMIKALAAKRGVIQINYELSFIDQAHKYACDRETGGVVQNLAAITKRCNNEEECISREVEQATKKLTAEGKLPQVSWVRIVDHIDHAIKLVGADLAEGMEDCSKLPKITHALIDKGYSDTDMRKILGGNAMRVLEQAERVSREMAAGK